jgi:DNA-binding MarR family transcriptional regulator
MCNPNIYQQQLSEILLLDKSKTARLLKTLEEEKKLITRTIGNSNNRLVYLLNITPSGKRLIKEIKPVMKQFLIELFENINNDEIQLLHGLSKKFQSDLDSVIERN